jgi:TldD protein
VPPSIDESFLALPLRRLAEAALARAAALGAEHADFRLERNRSAFQVLRDARPAGSQDSTDAGYGVRVVHGGSWGFASGADMTPEAAARVAEQAVEKVNPFDVPDAEKTALLADFSRRLLDHEAVSHVDARLWAVQENKFYADTAGTITTQQRIRILPELTATAVDSASGRFDTMRTLAPPAGRGWEYLTGTGWDWDTELAELPGLLAEKMAAPSVEPGAYDLVIDPTNLFLTIHESIGHATELDRALGYEAAYAGTSFATFDQLGTLRYGSEVMNVTGDRTTEHGLATIGFDDEGVETQSWDLVTNGVLTGYQMDRRSAALKGFERSNGCAFADSPSHVPLQRMANVSLQPAPGGPSTEELISRVERGIYIVGDGSWSIDMQRYNFQFTGQRFFRIENGRLAGQLRDVAYQATTTDFWGAMEAVGGPQTYVLGGSFMCGKAQPGQTAAVSHGCPSALFRGITILNTQQESGR